MTERLYYNDAYIFEFDATVTACEPDKKKYKITLDRSAFFPEGGGQPGDTGTIRYNDTVINVLDTQESNGNIYVVCNKPVDVNTVVHCEIDKAFRMANMVKHSGEHIFAGFANKLYGCKNVGFHMQSTAVGIDFDVQLSKDQIEKIENLTNEKIRENVEIRTFFPTDTELENTEFRSKKEIDGELRLVEIPDCDMCACCGTHVKYTGEIGIVKCVQFENYKGGTRLLLKIGADAIDDYRMRNDALLTVGTMLSAKPETTVACAEKFMAKSDEMRLEIATLKEKLYTVMAKNLTPGEKFTADITDTMPPADIMTYADIIMKKYGTGLVFSGCDKSFKFALCAGEKTDEIFAELKEKLGAKGGGRNGSCQGQTTASLDEIRAFIAYNIPNTK